MKSIMCLFILASSLILISAGRVTPIFEWKYIDYLWMSDAIKQNAIQTGIYDFSRILPMDVDKSKDGRVFVTFLGMDGVPATIGTITDQKGPSGPLVKPYPDWSWFKKNDCNSITSVYRIAIDECNRLWVLDTGFLEGQEMLCESQLLTFDLSTNQLINRIKIPNHIARNKDNLTLLANPIVETEGSQCEKTTVFMADTFGHGIVIWDGINLFRVESSLFNYTDKAKTVTVGNHTLDLVGGIVGMDVSPRLFPGESRFLYFHALASFDLYFADTQQLRRSKTGQKINFFGATNILSSQAIGQAFSSDGTLFFGMTKEIAIACWNRYQKLERKNIEIIAQDNETLQYANGLKVIPFLNNQADEELWILTNRFIGFQLGQLNPNEINFRILKSQVKSLTRGTICEIPPKTQFAREQINKDNGIFIIPD